jgi:heme oxygenase
VRYLGDLSGGQTIRHTISKAYGLDENAGLGLSFYAFKSLMSQKPANQGEMKRIKEWFREGMNAAGNLSVDVKGEKRTAALINSSDPLKCHLH